MEDEEGRDEFRPLCMAVGFIVLNWATVEQQMDIWVNIAFKHCGGEELRIHKDIPASFNQKARFLKDCFRRLPTLASFASEGQSLVERVSSLASERHNLVHSSLASLIPENGAFHFNKVGYAKDRHTLSSFTFTPIAFSKLEAALGDLLSEQIAFARRLTDRFPE